MRWDLRAVLAVGALLLASCSSPAGTSGDGEEPATTSSPVTSTAPVADPETTEAEASQSDGEFCDVMRGDQDAEVDALDPEAMEQHFTESLETLREMRSIAPEEIRGDLDLVIEYSEQAVELWKEYDYDVMAIPQAEYEALSTSELEQASARLSEFCGVDDVDDGPTTTTLEGGEPLADLIPPGTQSVVPTGVPGITQIDSTATFEEVVDFYRRVLGDEVNLAEDEGLGSAQFLDMSRGVVVDVQAQADGVTRVFISIQQ